MPPCAERPPAAVAVRVVAGASVVRLTGEVDLSHRARLRAVERLVVQQRRPVTVDLTAVTFADATLAGFVAAICERAHATVVAPTRLMRDVLRVYDVARGPVNRSG